MAEPDIQDLIVIRRRGPAEPEGVKGGVWKIAFADFMTAMMCFFLVMWLINAANEDTRQAVASYFNPVRLAELNRKGVADPHLTDTPIRQSGEKTMDPEEAGPLPGEQSTAEPPAPTATVSRDALFRDPYRVLADIAGEGAGPESGAGADTDAGAGPGAGGQSAAGQVFRDPFAPEVKAALPLKPEAPAENPPQRTPGKISLHEQQTPPPAAAAAAIPAAAPDAAGPPNDAPPAAAAAEASAVASAPAPLSMPPAPPAAAPSAVPLSESPGAASAPSLGSAIAAAVTQDGAGGRRPAVAVESTGEGTLISLTDDTDFGMFAIGSAEPRPETVRIMERIAAVLKTRPGTITIRGHTDARPFKGGGYDNWRLSTDRAQIAYYMLVRGGLEERRVEAIEGYADRKLKVASDPEAAENRRIEILIREDAP